jgi:hypothetical protein
LVVVFSFTETPCPENPTVMPADFRGYFYLRPEDWFVKKYFLDGPASDRRYGSNQLRARYFNPNAGNHKVDGQNDEVNAGCRLLRSQCGKVNARCRTMNA